MLKELAIHDDFLIAILKSALTEGYSQAMGSTVRNAFYSLPWKRLKETFGSEFLCERVSYLAGLSFDDAKTKHALSIALEYAEGKRKEDDRGDSDDDAPDSPEDAEPGDEEPYAVEIENEPQQANAMNDQDASQTEAGQADEMCSRNDTSSPGEEGTPSQATDEQPVEATAPSVAVPPARKPS